MKEEWEMYSHLMWLFGILSGMLFAYALIDMIDGNYIYSGISFTLGVISNIISESISKPKS
jgi:hypothetical protein